ncbi:MAG: hypothetical protein LBD55_11710 [Treponema sp.]|jgi:hypothetical protein|nr:hypothetical protein [Treponema sp.]
MRKMFLVFLWGLAAALGFAQNTAPAGSAGADDPVLAAEEETPVTSAEDSSEETPIYAPEKPASKPSVFAQYFRWGKGAAVRKDFILSTLFFMWDTDKQGIGEELFTLHWSFLPFTSVGVGLGLNGLFREGFAFPHFVGITAQVGIVLPVSAEIKVFGDFILETGYGTAGRAADTWFALNPGYDLGFVIMLDKDFGLEIKYKGILMPENRYISALGFGWLWNFWL